MSSLSAKDRVSLCSFTFSDGRRCRTPRLRNNSRFCPYHAQKEARARAAQSLGKDLAYFFSGDYLSACDLSTALGRLIPAVIRGDVKPRAARTVAYLAQTLMQAIHLSKHEYTNAFGTEHWRQSIRNSVKGNHDYLFPPAPKPVPSALRENLRSEPLQSHPAEPQPQPVETPANCHPERNEGSASSPSSSLATHHSPLPHAPQSEIPTLSGSAPSPQAPLPPTSSEFAQHLLAGWNLSRPAPDTSGGYAPQPAQSPPSQPVDTPANGHPERSEGSASSSSPLVSSPSPVAQVQQPASAPPSTPPQPTRAAQPFASLALPLPVRRRLHRGPA